MSPVTERLPIGGAVLAFALSLLGYGLLVQTAPYGDGILLLYALGQRVTAYHHVSYLVSVRAFADLAAGFGLDEVRAAYWFSVVIASIGNAFLYLLVAERCRSPLPRSAIVVLVASCPVLLFYATTVENPANHYGSVCIALWAVARCAAARHWTRWIVAGLAATLVPLSHASGPLLLGALALLVLNREGREPLLDGGERAVRLVAFLLPSALLWAFDKDVKRFVFATEHVDQVNPAAGQLLAIFDRGVDPSRWLPFLVHEWFLPAFGLWTVWLVATFELWRRARRLALVTLAAVIPYVVLFTMYQTWERGAYFVPLLPLAGWTLARASRTRALPPPIVLSVLLLAAAQATAGILQIRRHAARADAPWTWALGAREATKGSKGQVHVLTADLFRCMHLIVDHGLDGVHVPPWIEIWRRQRAADPAGVGNAEAFAELCAARVREMRATGPVYISEELWHELSDLLPQLKALLQADHELEPVQSGSFRGFALAPRH